MEYYNRYFLHLAYNGSAYRGYQRQANVVSVQSTIEDTLSEVLGQTIVMSGCGRTDAGVHASQYFGSIDLKTEWEDSRLAILNRRLPADISCFEVIPVHSTASTRFDAKQRTYDYFIHLDKSAGLNHLSTWYPASRLDLAQIRLAASCLVGRKDFSAFCKVPDRHHSTVCELLAVDVFSDVTGRFLRFRFIGNRFLRGMIRLLVGNLLLVGEGKMSTSEFEAHLINRTAPKFHNLAAANGLYLSGVTYDYCLRPNCNPIQQLLVGLSQ